MSNTEFVENLNKALVQLNSQLGLQAEKEEFYCNIFILGVPRSGTTLLSQLIYQGLNIGCSNHLMARFPNAPLVGAILSSIVLPHQKKGADFKSEYARTFEASSPHEFSWFWWRILNMENGGHMELYNKDLAEIDWENVKDELLSINSVLQSHMVYKTLELTGRYLNEFYELFQKSIFVYLQRDELATCRSIYNARVSQNQNLEDWWSSIPPNYSELKDLSVEEQIVGQVISLNKYYQDQISALSDQDRIVKVRYEEFCTDPYKLLSLLKVKVDNLTDKEIVISKGIRAINPSESRVPDEIEKEFIDLLEE